MSVEASESIGFVMLKPTIKRGDYLDGASSFVHVCLDQPTQNIF